MVQLYFYSPNATQTLSIQLATKSSLETVMHLKHVATLYLVKHLTSVCTAVANIALPYVTPSGDLLHLAG